MKTLLRISVCGLIAAFSSLNSAFSQVNCTGTVSTGQNLVTNGGFSNLYSGWDHDPAYTNYAPCTDCYSVPGNIYAGSTQQNFNQAFSNFPDHSTSGDNNFLMVDGICTPGIDLWRQSNIPIIPNTNYYFSVWITSLSPASLAESGTLNFNINGQDLPTTIAAPGVVGQWVRFPGVVWNSGLNPPATITISIQNTTTTACDRAVDFGIDDITFTQGCDFGVTGPQPTLGPDYTLCGRTLPYTINPNFSAATAASPNMTYTWYKNGVQQTKGMGPGFYNFSVTGPGTYTICADSAGSCPKSDELVITDNTHPPTRAWSPDSVFCTGSLSKVRLRVVGGSGTTLQWYAGSCGGTPIASSPNGAEVSVNAPSVPTRYYARWESGIACQTTCQSVLVTPFAPPGTANAGPRQDLCNATSASLSANAASPSGAIGTWSIVSGTANLPSPVNNPQATVTGLVTGDVTLKWTISNGPCPVSSSNVVIHVDPFTAPTIIGSSLNQCATATEVDYHTSVYNPTSTYTWVKTGSLVIKDQSTNHVKVDIGNTGGTLTVTEKNGACTSTSSVDITSTLPLSATAAGQDQQLCNAASTNLEATIPPSPAVGFWKIISGTGSIADADTTKYNALVTGLLEGDLTLRWTIQNSPCLQKSDDVVIHVDALTAPTITGSSLNQCATATDVDYHTSVYNPTSTYTWVKTGSLVIKDQSTNHVKVDVGNTGGTLTVTEKKGACTFSSSIDITSTLPLSATAAGQDQQLCNTTSTNLEATVPPSPAVGFWKIISGTGSIADADTTKYNALVTGLVEGDLTLRWTIQNSPCLQKSDDVVIHVDALTAPTIIGAPLSQCATATDVDYQTSVYNPTSTYTWVKTGSLVIKDQSTNHVTVDVGNTGGTLTVSEKKGACTLSSSVNINSVQPLTAASAGAHQKLCNTTSTTLEATAPAAPSIGFWKIISGTGSIADADTTKFNAPLTGLVPGGVVLLRWTIRNSPCVDSSADVTVRMDTLSPPRLLGPSFDTCALITGITYVTDADHSSASTYKWYTSGSPNTLVITDTTANYAKVDVGASGGTITVTETIGGCSFSASKDISILPNITAANAGPDQSSCLNYSTLKATSLSVGKGHWTLIAGSGNFEHASSSTTFVGGLSNGINTFRWEVTGCGGPLADTVSITVGASNMTLDLTGPTDTLCVGTERTLTLVATGGSSNYYYTWKSSDSSFNTITTYTPVVVVPLNGTTTYYVIATDTLHFGCVSNKDSITVHAVHGQNLSMNNLMTPNGDRLNDQFIVRDGATMQKLLPGAELDVYNKWGARVYRQKDYDNSWEGSDLPAGVYYYHIKSGCGEGLYKGWVQIIR
jgi:gliding motility-associated-like protein